MNSRSELTERIRTLRRRTGLTGKQFSQKYHIPFNTLRKWEGGFRKPPIYVVELLEYRIKGAKNHETDNYKTP